MLQNDPEAHFSVGCILSLKFRKETGSTAPRGADRVERPSSSPPQLMAWRSSRVAGEKKGKQMRSESGPEPESHSFVAFHFVGQ